MLRTESEIFSELEKLCASPGYAHAVAFLCFRDNMMPNIENLLPEIIAESFSIDRLIKVELSALIGLMTKENIDLNLPSQDIIQLYINRTENLLSEIHQVIIADASVDFTPENIKNKDFNPFNNGSVLREVIFYASDSAFNFQYRDLFRIKYKDDNDWFIENKKYSVDEASIVISSIEKFQRIKISDTLENVASEKQSNWTMLSGFIFNASDIVKICNLDNKTVKGVIDSFSKPIDSNNSDYKSIGDFNIVNAYPIIPIDDENYILFQCYSLLEASYETPFFWFNNDKLYKNQAMTNRGEFTEKYTYEKLVSVFGDKNVFIGVDIKNNNKTYGEIDVLVIYANRAIIVQAKSKKLTLAARKGNDKILKDDFKKAVQNAYNQAFSCAELLLDSSYKLYNSTGDELNVLRSFKEIYIFCVISDHYPALSFQSLNFLEYKKNKTILVE